MLPANRQNLVEVICSLNTEGLDYHQKYLSLHKYYSYVNTAGIYTYRTGFSDADCAERLVI